LSGPATEEIDFASAAPTVAVSGSFGVPARAGSPVRSDPNLYGNVLDFWARNPGGHFVFHGGPNIGWPTHMARSADGDSIEYDLSYAALAAFPPVVTLLYVYGPTTAGGEARVSEAYLEGVPADGVQAFTLLDVPQVTTPESPITSHPLLSPIEWELFDTGVTPTIYIRDPAREFRDVWWITAQSNATTVTVPEPPSVVDIATVLGTARLRGQLGIVADDPGDVEVLRSQSDPFIVQP
jgi:hypothetical protein